VPAGGFFLIHQKSEVMRCEPCDIEGIKRVSEGVAEAREELESMADGMT
jgi:hypothetical protein